jgi:hypothetical protein
MGKSFSQTAEANRKACREVFGGRQGGKTLAEEDFY